MKRAALLLLAAAAPLPPVPSHAVFGRWIVVCDNTRRCEARGLPEMPGSADLRVTRAAGNVPAIVTLTIADPHDPGTLRADSAPLPAFGWKAARGDGNTALVLTLDRAEDIATLIARLRTARTLTWEGLEVPIPLDGMAAALLRVDAVQGRPGTPTPLVAPRGRAPVPSAPPLPRAPRWLPPPSLDVAEANRLLAATRAAARPALQAGDCDPTWSEEDGADPLDRRHALVILSCMRHAYQTSSVAFVVARQGPPSPVRAVLPMPSMPPERWLVSGSFDIKTGTLGTFSKGRGLADCGYSALWIWSAGAFVPVAASDQELCGGAAAGDWPILLRTVPPRRNVP